MTLAAGVDRWPPATQGQKCRMCGQSEAEHARNAGCCNGCTHWEGLDEHGNEAFNRLGRPTKAHGTQAGYDRHMYRGDYPCQPCREAHAVYNARKKREKARRANANRMRQIA